jgi:hypothetical protein
MRIVRSLALFVYFAGFLLGSVGLFVFEAPFAIIVACFSSFQSGVMMFLFHEYKNNKFVPSTSERRKLYILYPAITLASLLSLILEVPLHEISLLSAWVLLSLLLLLHFDTFKPFLTYFGKRKPLVSGVRSYYHISLFLFYFSIGAGIISVTQLIPFTQRLSSVSQNQDIALLFGFVGIAFMLLMSVFWRVYRKEHAIGERVAITIYRNEFVEQIKDGKLSALPPEELEKYVNS